MENDILSEKPLCDLPDSHASVASKSLELTYCGAKYLIYGASALSIVVGLAALFGRFAGQPILGRWLPEASNMVPEAAIGSVVAAIGFWLVQAKKSKLISAISILLQFLGWLNLVIMSPALSNHRLSILADPSVRLAPGTAVCFILLGIGLAVLSRAKISIVALWGIALLGVGVGSLGLVTLVAYGSGLVAVSWWGALSLQMAMPTAVAIFCLGTALVGNFFQQAKSASRHLAIAAAVLAILGLLLLFAGVDAAVLVSSNSVLTTRVENRKGSTEIRAIQSLVDFTRKSEAGQRGYLLTGDLRYLAAFDTGLAGYKQLLRDKTVHDAELRESAKHKFDELVLTIDLVRQGHRNQALLVVKSADGLRYMDEIEARAKILTAALQKANLVRQTESQESILSVRRTILLSYCLAVLFAGGALLLVGFDVRRRSRIETELREKETKMISALQDQTFRAQEASRAKSSFLASMSHEIRTPMNAILGMADMLWESDLSEAQRHYVEVFRRAGGSLLVLINDILDFSKIESGSFCLELVDFDLQEVVDQVIEILLPRAESKKLSLFAHVDAGTPAHIQGDPARLQQILLNLVSNAVKFTDEGQVSLQVRSRNTSTHSCLQFEVIDTGIGIPADKLGCIFEDFTQAESSTTRRFGGTGLGLSISRGLAKHMGGDLRVSSQVGKGSTFFFNVILPIGLEPKPGTLLHLDEIAGKRVLIVDNNATNRVILGEMCSAWGMTVTSCRSGAEAVAATRASLGGQPFGVALVDRMMPEMDGFETVHNMRLLDPNIAVLIVSSDSQAGDIARCRQLGFCGHLIKPVRRTELLQQIVKALSNISELVPTIEEDRLDKTPLVAAKRMRLLVAEDSQDNRFLLQAYCKGTDFELIFAEDGKRAVAAFESGSFDLILMDVQMPVMDGLSATRQIRAIEAARGSKRTPILALTANALAQDVARSSEAGCDAHLAKPISRKNFLRALQQWQTTPAASVSSVRIEIPDGLEELALGYLAKRQRELSVLESLLERSDLDEIRRMAHNLKGSGTSYGFPDITRLGAQMEEACKDRNLEVLSTKVYELSAYTNAASQQMAVSEALSG